jgi:ERCC4-type nuclease
LVDFINKNRTEKIFVVCDRHIVKRDILFQIKCIGLKCSDVHFYTLKEFTAMPFFSNGFKQIYCDQKTTGFRELISDSKNLDEVYEVLQSESSNIVKRFKSCFDNKNDVKLDFKVLLYDLNIVVLRFCEYLGNIKSISVDSLAFKDSIEEERFLNSIRKEKFYFEQLIEKRAKVPIILDNDFDILEDESSHEEDNVYSVVIDIRELRAELVFILYKSGNKIHISTLKVGDYLLSDEICIERKSIADLISSFNSGRLYTQALALTHAYVSPYLLLEFKGRPCLSDYCNIKAEGFKNSLISKLTIFMISFPTVKLIWSPNSLFSVKAMRILQKKTHNTESEQTIDIDPNLLDILLSIPGITQFNLKKVQKGYKNLKHLATSPRGELISALGEANGCKIFNFFNEEIQHKEN